MTASPDSGTLFDDLMALRHETGGVDLDPFLPSRAEPDRLSPESHFAQSDKHELKETDSKYSTY